jgi:hypothetical protein
MNNIIVNLIIILSPIIYILGLFYYYHDWKGKVRREEENDYINIDLEKDEEDSDE